MRIDATPPIIVPPSAAFVIHCLEPFRIQCFLSAESTAFVFAPSASEPEPASLSA